MKFLYTCDMLYTVGTYVIKLSLTCTLLRVIQSRAQFTVVAIVAITGAIITVASFLEGTLYCTPMFYLWERFENPDAEGSCAPFWTRRLPSFLHGVWILIADSTLGLIIPTMLLWGALMHFRIKMSIRILLGLGSIASLATVLRIVYLAIQQNTPTANIALALWSVIELAISIMAIAAATWKPLFVKFHLVEPGVQSTVRLKTRQFPDEENNNHNVDNNNKNMKIRPSFFPIGSSSSRQDSSGTTTQLEKQEKERRDSAVLFPGAAVLKPVTGL